MLYELKANSKADTIDEALMPLDVIVKYLGRASANKINIFSAKSHEKYLNDLCDKYGCDKGSNLPSSPFYPWPAHNYTSYYSTIFAHCRENIQNVFEFGIGTTNPNIQGASKGVITRKPGASLRVWREYFNKASIFAADIDRDILIEEDRISSFYVDQLDIHSLERMWSNFDDNLFDVIIDDGLHTLEAGINTLIASISKLKKNGIYIIEDISPDLLIQYERILSETNRFDVEYIILQRENCPLNDNNLITVRLR